MKRFILVLFLGFTFLATSQDSKVTTGQIQFEEGDYQSALESLDLALKKPSDLKERNLAKAYFYRAKARMAYMGVLAQSSKEGEKLSEKELDLVKDALFSSWEDYKKAAKHDDGKLTLKIKQEQQLLATNCLVYGIQIFSQSYTTEAQNVQKKAYVIEAKKYLSIASEGNPENYMPLDLLAQIELSLGDSTVAQQQLEQAIELFTKHPPQDADLLIAYTCYRLALLEAYKDEDYPAAIRSIQRGKTLLDQEFRRAETSKSSYTDQQWKSLEQQYAQVQEDLNKFELNLYLNTPDLLQEALAKFEEACKVEPQNYKTHVAYAQLLENAGQQEKAIAVYETAIKIDPKDHLAYFNLAALYVNQANVLFQQANATEDYQKSKALQQEGNALYTKALPHIQQVTKLSPCNKIALDTLKQIAITLSSDDAEMTALYAKTKSEAENCGF